MTFYYFIISILIAFELQKLIQLNFFFRIKMLFTSYSKRILKKTSTTAYKEFFKIALIDICYFIIICIGLFTINRYFFCAILFLSILKTLIFKLKNKTFKKFWFILDIIFSITLLSLSIINFSYYQIDGIQFIKQFIKL